jgi:hypothetical protein
METCTADERFYDYTMRPYRPAVDPAGKLRGANLLFEFASRGGQPEKWRALVADLRRELGPNRTVWGLKLVDGKLSGELYFYFRAIASSSVHREDPADAPTPISWDQVCRALGGSLRPDPRLPAHAPWIMVSVDVDDEILQRGTVEVLHLYLNSGLSFDVRREGIEHANHYTFFEMSEMERLRALMEHLGNGLVHGSACGVQVQKVLLPRLYSCRTICLAAKRTCDGIYFAGIPTDRLLWFLRERGWPAFAVDFVENNQEALSHLRWDVGLDFVAENGEIRWRKSAVYGVL